MEDFQINSNSTHDTDTHFGLSFSEIQLVLLLHLTHVNNIKYNVICHASHSKKLKNERGEAGADAVSLQESDDEELLFDTGSDEIVWKKFEKCEQDP